MRGGHGKDESEDIIENMDYAAGVIGHLASYETLSEKLSVEDISKGSQEAAGSQERKAAAESVCATTVNCHCAMGSGRDSVRMTAKKVVGVMKIKRAMYKGVKLLYQKSSLVLGIPSSTTARTAHKQWKALSASAFEDLRQQYDVCNRKNMLALEACHDENRDALAKARAEIERLKQENEGLRSARDSAEKKAQVLSAKLAVRKMACRGFQKKEARHRQETTEHKRKMVQMQTTLHRAVHLHNEQLEGALMELMRSRTNVRVVKENLAQAMSENDFLRKVLRQKLMEERVLERRILTIKEEAKETQASLQTQVQLAENKLAHAQASFSEKETVFNEYKSQSVEIIDNLVVALLDKSQSSTSIQDDAPVPDEEVPKKSAETRSPLSTTRTDEEEDEPSTFVRPLSFAEEVGVADAWDCTLSEYDPVSVHGRMEGLPLFRNDVASLKAGEYVVRFVTRAQ